MTFHWFRRNFITDRSFLPIPFSPICQLFAVYQLDVLKFPKLLQTVNGIPDPELKLFAPETGFGLKLSLAGSLMSLVGEGGIISKRWRQLKFNFELPNCYANCTTIYLCIPIGLSNPLGTLLAEFPKPIICNLNWCTTFYLVVRHRSDVIVLLHFNDEWEETHKRSTDLVQIAVSILGNRYYNINSLLVSFKHRHRN